MSTNLTATLNGTSREGQPLSCLNPTAERVGKTLVLSLLFVISLAGNAFIGIIVYKTKSMRKPRNIFIVNMAMSDLLFPILQFPRIVIELFSDSWLINGFLGQALCKLVSSLPYISVSVSIQSMVLIAVDRFGAVVFPLRSPLVGLRLCPVSIVTTWIISVSLYSPFLFALGVFADSAGRKTCGVHETEFLKKYAVSVVSILVYVPLVLIAILYFIIYLRIKF